MNLVTQQAQAFDAQIRGQFLNPFRGFQAGAARFHDHEHFIYANRGAAAKMFNSGWSGQTAWSGKTEMGCNARPAGSRTILPYVRQRKSQQGAQIRFLEQAVWPDHELSKNKNHIIMPEVRKNWSPKRVERKSR